MRASAGSSRVPRVSWRLGSVHHVAGSDALVDVAVAKLSHLLSDGEVGASVVQDSSTDAGGSADHQHHGAGDGPGPGQNGDAPSDQPGTEQGQDEAAPDPTGSHQVASVSARR